MKVLQLTVHLFPNVGGVETHLKDLIDSLVKKDWKVFVLAYQPLSTKTVWKIHEKHPNLEIFRLPWLAGLFYKFIPYPKLEFLYLFPGLFFSTPIFLFLKRPDIIHAHGLVSAAVAVFWGKIFRIDVVVSTHSIYTFPKSGLYHDFAKVVFQSAKKVLCLSRKSLEEIQSLGVKKDKISLFTYWIDLEKFQTIEKAKKKLGWDSKFTVLFVGRLVSEKGIEVLLNSVKKWNKGINLIFAGNGPLEKDIRNASSEFPNVKFAGKVSQEDLPLFYSGADCLIVPSTSEEGFGRVIIESLACGTPVVASEKGAIPEAMDKTVGRFIEVTPKNIKDEINYLYKNPSVLKKLAQKARKFVERRYSENNVQTIIKTYTG